MLQVPGDYRSFVVEVIRDLYAERPSLMVKSGTRPGRRRAPRSTERAIVGRMAIHAHSRVAGTFGDKAFVDFEYERVGPGRIAKKMADEKISPDLIVHERDDRSANFLVIEVKRAEHGKPRAWGSRGPAREDYRKLHFFTRHLETAEPPGMRSYRWGLYLEFDVWGADFWWLPRGEPGARCDTVSFDCSYEGEPGAPHDAIHERLDLA